MTTYNFEPIENIHLKTLRRNQELYYRDKGIIAIGKVLKKIRVGWKIKQVLLKIDQIIDQEEHDPRKVGDVVPIRVGSLCKMTISSKFEVNGKFRLLLKPGVKLRLPRNKDCSVYGNRVVINGKLKQVDGNLFCYLRHRGCFSLPCKSVLKIAGQKKDVVWLG